MKKRTVVMVLIAVCILFYKPILSVMFQIVQSFDYNMKDASEFEKMIPDIKSFYDDNKLLINEVEQLVHDKSRLASFSLSRSSEESSEIMVSIYEVYDETFNEKLEKVKKTDDGRYSLNRIPLFDEQQTETINQFFSLKKGEIQFEFINPLWSIRIESEGLASISLDHLTELELEEIGKMDEYKTIEKIDEDWYIVIFVRKPI